MSKVYYDSDDLSPVLAGRYVTKVDGDTLTLDDGTVLEFEGNEGCCCGSGDYWLTELFQRGTPNARIMSAEVETTQLGDDEYDDTRYTLFVIVDDERLPLAEVEGNDGNGYYGSGFHVTVTRKDAHRAHAHNPGDHTQRRAVSVAARCLLLLDDIGVADPVKEVVDASVDETLGPLTWREDLYVPAVERISRLLAYLGDVAENYDYGTDDGCRLVLKEVTELLASKAICAALAAERGLWQEEKA